MKTLKESYTVMIIPTPISKAYRFSFSKQALKIILGTTTVITILLVVFIIQYFYMVGDMWELKSLRKETRSQKIQIQTFASNVTDLKKQMARLKDLDAKLRVITDIGPPPQSDQLMGMGGPEERGTDAVYQDGAVSAEDIKKMDQDLDRLKTDASAQELSFEELTEAMKDRRSLWASTPSVWPVRGWLTSGFGNRISPFTGSVTMHNGIDVASRRDTPVQATAGGVVSYEGFDSGLGKVIKLNHGYGMQTIYGHLAKVNVRIGQKVKRGDIIGFVGNTGLSTGPHVHYEVFVNNVPVNPLRYILN
ncbi:MAG: M23 family metallopeptidase [Nitrospirae bacterium]|nr:M23 family metallopeptidase [Nitrospirota bacterium]